jgi:hypothetical protein
MTHYPIFKNLRSLFSVMKGEVCFPSISNNSKRLKSALRDCLATYPPDPPSLSKGRGSVGKRGVSPLSINLFPLSFEGEGDKGGEVSKHSLSDALYLERWKEMCYTSGKLINHLR